MPTKGSRPLKDEVKRLRLIRITDQGGEIVHDIVVREFPLTIVLNGIELVTLLCTPTNLKYLAVGFLHSEGLIKSKKDIRSIALDQKRGVIWVETKGGKKVTSEFLATRYITTGCGKGTSFLGPAGRALPKMRSKVIIPSADILALMREFQERSEVHRLTGGVHNAALCDRKNIVVFSEDIGRHSAIDKILGECLLREITTRNKLVITSGRISSEILLKIARARIPIIVSKSAPTDLGVKLADQAGITLVGFAHGKRMNVYSNAWRIVTSSSRSSRSHP